MGSPRIKRFHQHHPQAVSRCLVAVCAAALLAGCNGGTVDQHALKQDSKAISSLATEGSLFAEKVAKGESTGPYTRIQADNLGTLAANLADSLGRRKTSPGIEPKVRKAGKLAAQVAEQFKALQDHPSDRAVARSVQQAFGPLADQADKLAK
ncbi:MAG: hypothetical protein QOG29_1745 [Gaiellaceae bacterium]|jgi:hypothetical protein|nr:hypothetical protein [Gaiellaceae bacterium]MDX6517305.1 hypothetical protein [Gaiellaceae bacterium]